MSSRKYLTKAQKDAIVKKIENLRREKIDKITNDVRKTYKPSSEDQSIINDAREMNRLFSKIEQIAKKYEAFNEIRMYNTYTHVPATVDYVKDKLIQKVVKDKSEHINTVNVDDIRIELELAEVKDFNIDEFIKRFI